jgi:hypothetical protein
MKNIYNILILIILVSFFSSCKKELTSEGVSRLTHYVTFELTKGGLVINPKGTAYVDPGYKAIEGTTDVTTKVTVDGTVNTNKVGLYVLTYSATNSDGFSASVSRSVIVYDPAAPATDLTGNYSSNVSRIAPARAFTGLSVTITKKAPGFFYVSDFLGGFYDQGANYRYGPAFALTGYMQLNADNSLSYVSSYNAAWGDAANSFTNGVYDPVTKGLTWKVNYTSSNYSFVVTLTRI